MDLDAQIDAAHARYRTARPNSAAADTRAREVLPAGNTRSVLDFAPFPFRVSSADGSELVDIDGLRYVDFCGNYTAGLLGHSPEHIKTAIHEALESGWALGATHEREVELAERLCARFESLEQVRFTNSGTEANLMAIGTALDHAGRTTIGVFERAYHGGVLVELVQGSGGCRPASKAFVQELRERCDAHDVVLIFDEVMTSRLDPGGAQARYGVIPDMTTLGKYIGGGMTFGAFGGRREIMCRFDPAQGGPLTQAGTFNNNVVSMSAAIATLDHELDPARLEAVNARGDDLRDRLNGVFAEHAAPFTVTGMGSMLNIHADDDRLLELLFHKLLDDGLYIARRGFIALSMAVTTEDCDRLVECVSRVTRDLGALAVPGTG